MMARQPRDSTPESDGNDAKTNVNGIVVRLLFHSIRTTATKAIFITKVRVGNDGSTGVSSVKLGVASTRYWTTNGVVVVSAGRHVKQNTARDGAKIRNSSDLVRFDFAWRITRKRKQTYFPYLCTADSIGCIVIICVRTEYADIRLPATEK